MSKKLPKKLKIEPEAQIRIDNKDFNGLIGSVTLVGLKVNEIIDYLKEKESHE